jgi:cellulose synthase/poly-beta-1,6-N-acetylglucosamine synthase-like glycosyltransferase
MFNDPEVGCVTTMKRLRGMASHGEGIYWRYEYLVKMLESRTSSSAGADGGFYAIRRDLYRPLHEANNLADDLALSISVWLYSKKILVAESIFSYEESATSIADEYKRKTRIAEGSCRVLLLNGWLLSPWHNRYFLEFFSHKVLRWAGPYLILIPFVCSALLSGIIIYRIFFILSVVFILAGLMGITALTSVPLFAVIGQFALANVAQVHGLYNLIFNPKPAYWKPRSG